MNEAVFEPDLSLHIAGVKLEHPVMNAAGTCKNTDDARTIGRSASAAVMVGSVTTKKRDGNDGNVYWQDGTCSLNSLGLKNPGATSFQEAMPTLADIAHAHNKPLFVSVAGFSPMEYADLVEMAIDIDADFIELNLGCPNIWDNGAQKRIACFDPALVETILDHVATVIEERVPPGDPQPIAVKLSPFSDPVALQETTDVLSHSAVDAVTTVNTFPNACAFDEQSGLPCITPADGLAGMGGKALKPIGLGQVAQLRNLLPEHIDIIGVGGITCGRDILDYLRAGAVAVQVATAYFQHHERVFERLLTEYLDALT